MSYLECIATWFSNAAAVATGLQSAAVLTSDAFQCTFTLMVATTVFCFVASAINNNDSWVDRLWSLSPILYAWVLALPASGWSTSTMFAALITLWGLRLTYNFYRKGGYTCGGEDYRWLHVRSWRIFKAGIFSRALWLIFSFFIVSAYQCTLLWAIAVPVQFLPKDTAPTTADYCFAALFLVFLSLETLADQQQWLFQNQKYKKLPRKADLANDYDIGFCTHGVFAYSRHLNVWSEQMIWVVVYSAAAWHTAPYEYAAGCIVLVALTVGSTRLTEALSAAKYPKYKIYQSITPMLLPYMGGTGAQLDRALTKAK